MSGQPQEEGCWSPWFKWFESISLGDELLVSSLAFEVPLAKEEGTEPEGAIQVCTG